jgi:hypothetical protein
VYVLRIVYLSTLTLKPHHWHSHGTDYDIHIAVDD